MRNSSIGLAQLQHAAKGEKIQYKIAASSPMYHTRNIKTRNQITLHSHWVPPAILWSVLAVANQPQYDGYLRFLSVHAIFCRVLIGWIMLGMQYLFFEASPEGSFCCLSSKQLQLYLHVQQIIVIVQVSSWSIKMALYDIIKQGYLLLLTAKKGTFQRKVSIGLIRVNEILKLICLPEMVQVLVFIYRGHHPAGVHLLQERRTIHCQGKEYRVYQI